MWKLLTMMSLSLYLIQIIFITTFTGQGKVLPFFISNIFQSRFIFTGLVPFLYLSLMNLLIYRKLRMNEKSSVRSRSPVTKSAGNLATILIIVGRNIYYRVCILYSYLPSLVLVFLITNIPRLVLNLAELATMNSQGNF